MYYFYTCIHSETEAHAILPMGTGHADSGHQNPAFLDAVVGGPD